MSITLTMGGQKIEELCLPTLQALSNAGFTLLGEEVLSRELISEFAERSYSIAWKGRKSASGERDLRPIRDFPDLLPEEKEFITSLATGKLSYLVSFVTNAGFYEMLRIGESSLSLKDVAFNSAIDIRDNLARLHHENWLNQNSEIGRVSPWNYEWGEYPPGRKYGYELQRIQVDMDCLALCDLTPLRKAHLLGLSVTGENGAFFHEGAVLSVRSDKPAPPAGGLLKF